MRNALVTNGRSNAVAVIRLGENPKVVGLIPTGWSPNSNRVSSDGGALHREWEKRSRAKPGLHLKNKEAETKPGMGVQLSGKNEYIISSKKPAFLLCLWGAEENWNI